MLQFCTKKGLLAKIAVERPYKISTIVDRIANIWSSMVERPYKISTIVDSEKVAKARVLSKDPIKFLLL